jgi:hypothetical protein
MLVGGAAQDCESSGRFKFLSHSQIQALTRALIPPALGNRVCPELSQASTSAAAPRPSLYRDKIRIGYIVTSTCLLDSPDN